MLNAKCDIVVCDEVRSANRRDDDERLPKRAAEISPAPGPAAGAGLVPGAPFVGWLILALQSSLGDALTIPFLGEPMAP